MNYGPLEFAAYLEHRGDRQDAAAVEAARAAAPIERAELNRLTIVFGKTWHATDRGGGNVGPPGRVVEDRGDQTPPEI